MTSFQVAVGALSIMAIMLWWFGHMPWQRLDIAERGELDGMKLFVVRDIFGREREAVEYDYFLHYVDTGRQVGKGVGPRPAAELEAVVRRIQDSDERKRLDREERVRERLGVTRP